MNQARGPFSASDNMAPSSPPQDETSQSLTLTEDKPISHLQRIPPELRNRIYDLILLEDEPIDVRTPWPAITKTCKQLRLESLPLYLGSNNFVAFIIDRKDHYLFRWLDTIAALNASVKKFSIRPMRIVIAGKTLWHSRARPKGHRRRNPLYTPSFEYWEPFVARLAAYGLRAQQLEWPGIEYLDVRNDYVSGVSHTAWREKYLFNENVLTPLLAAHRLLDPQQPPVNVSTQMQPEWEYQGLNWVHRGSLGEHARRLTYDDPAYWYKDWVEGWVDHREEGS